MRFWQQLQTTCATGSRRRGTSTAIPRGRFEKSLAKTMPVTCKRTSLPGTTTADKIRSSCP